MVTQPFNVGDFHINVTDGERNAMTEKLWKGRFSDKTDRSVETFTASIDIDKRLYRHDIEGSIAHARMLAETGIISEKEGSLLVKGLGDVQAEIEADNFKCDDALEDIHMHVESRLFELIGTTAWKLHTGRSRNDQIAVDLRLFLRQEVHAVLDQLYNLRRVLVELAEQHTETVLPGYTHLQRAQPVIFGHHLLAYYEMLSRDSERFHESLKRIDVMPLGCAALAGTPLPINREYAAELLGFSAIADNSIDAVSDRDFIMEFLAAASICMVHLSRMSEELILWATAEFGFIRLPDAYATGSSIMPQKKNPDVPELVRGKTGQVIGSLMSMLMLMKSLPLSYNRDMQEDKIPLFSGVDTLKACLHIFSRMLPNLEIGTDNMKRAAEKGFLNATDLADYLVGHGIPFRNAHEIAGESVKYALEKGKELHELSLAELRRFSEHIKEDVYQTLSVREMVDRRRSHGGTARENVKKAVITAKKRLSEEESTTR